MIGKLFSTAARIVNAPLDAAERVMGREKDEDRLASLPLEKLAESLEDSDRAFEEKNR